MDEQDVEFTLNWYRRYCARILIHVLGWDQDRAAAWVGDHLSGAGLRWRGFLLHEPPSWYVVRLLIPEDLAEVLKPDDMRELKRDVVRALGPDDDFDYAEISDFGPVRRRLEDVYRRYRSRPPR